MPRLVLKGYILIPERDLAAVQHELVNHRRLTREEPGCITFDVTQDITDTYRYNVHETFVDRAAFEYHQQRVARSEWGRLTCHAQRHYEIVE